MGIITANGTLGLPARGFPAASMPLAGIGGGRVTRDLVSIADLAPSEFVLLLDRALHLQQADLDSRLVAAAPLQLDPLAGRAVVTMFFEASTRTSTSFQLAAQRLGAHVVHVAAQHSSVGKGESLQDTMQTLAAYDPATIVVRHPRAGAVRDAARWSAAPVVNAGDGAHEHPTQALLDLVALRARLGADLTGLHVWIVGDVRHSRVARSGIQAFRRAGCEVTVCGPPTLIPAGIEQLGCTVTHDLARVGEADVVYALRMQHERMHGSYVPSLREYARSWQVRAEHLRPGQLVMHPGPVNRGVELAHELVDSPQSLILDQVRAGLYARMAVLEHATAGIPTTTRIAADPATTTGGRPA
jgi:aspartate carbamoyltransferase catalytic subunit